MRHLRISTRQKNEFTRGHERDGMRQRPVAVMCAQSRTPDAHSQLQLGTIDGLHVQQLHGHASASLANPVPYEGAGTLARAARVPARQKHHSALGGARGLAVRHFSLM
jgi:hypothetical protein